MSGRRFAVAVLLLTGGAGLVAQNFKRTDSRSTFVHRLDLYDVRGKKIDPADPAAPPYSPTETCKKCHDVDAIAHGWHFSTASGTTGGPPGEPWIQVDARTGTWLPLSYRGWPGTRRPDDVGLSPSDFAVMFGRHLPGGLDTYAGDRSDAPRRASTGELAIDCMACHDAAGTWSRARWVEQIEAQNFAWAPAAALGFIAVDGRVADLPDDVDPQSEAGAARLPKVRWDACAFDVTGHAHFDVVRTPRDEACYGCHTAQPVGEFAVARWQRDGDVHLRAGMHCADCHRNDIEHHTVRGYAGEQHPSGADVRTLSCRGCHLGETEGHSGVRAAGGRLGAPEPLHRGLPPVHLEKLSCTACHAGVEPSFQPTPVQTSMAHALGLALQGRSPADPPTIVEPVMRPGVDGVIRPHRLTWPSYWGRITDAGVEPIPVATALPVVRRELRVRRDLRAEIAELEPDVLQQRIAATLAAFGDDGGAAVLVSGGRLWRRSPEGSAVVASEHPAAEPVAWPIGHDVRPARLALGARGCVDCHAPEAPFFHQWVVAAGVVPDPEPPATFAHQELGYDGDLMAAWEASFAGRDPFKWIGFGSVGLVAVLLLLHLLVGLDAILRWLRGDRAARSAGSDR